MDDVHRKLFLLSHSVWAAEDKVVWFSPLYLRKGWAAFSGPAGEPRMPVVPIEWLGQNSSVHSPLYDTSLSNPSSWDGWGWCWIGRDRLICHVHSLATGFVIAVFIQNKPVISLNWLYSIIHLSFVEDGLCCWESRCVAHGSPQCVSRVQHCKMEAVLFSMYWLHNILLL